MRNMIITFAMIILIIVSSFCAVDLKVTTQEDVMMIYLDKLLTTTPETEEEIFHINIFGRLDIDTYIISNYSEIATERMMKYMLGNGLIGYSSGVAFKTNSNVNIKHIEITSTQTSDGKIYFDFKGVTEVVSVVNSESFEYPIVGQIGIKSVDGLSKVDTCRFFTIDLLDYPFR